jgi:hypothetical protein
MPSISGHSVDLEQSSQEFHVQRPSSPLFLSLDFAVESKGRLPLAVREGRDCTAVPNDGCISPMLNRSKASLFHGCPSVTSFRRLSQRPLSRVCGSLNCSNGFHFFSHFTAIVIVNMHHSRDFAVLSARLILPTTSRPVVMADKVYDQSPVNGAFHNAATSEKSEMCTECTRHITPNIREDTDVIDHRNGNEYGSVCAPQLAVFSRHNTQSHSERLRKGSSCDLRCT